MLWLLECVGLVRPYSNSQPFSEHYRQANFSMLALRVVTARIHIILNGSFMFPINETLPNVESQVFTPNIPMPGAGVELWHVKWMC